MTPELRQAVDELRAAILDGWPSLLATVVALYAVVYAVVLFGWVG